MPRYFKPVSEVMEAIRPLTNGTALRVMPLDRYGYLLMQTYLDHESQKSKSAMIGLVRAIDDLISTEIIWMPDALRNPIFSQYCFEVTRAVKALEKRVEEMV